MMHKNGPLLQIADATPESNIPRERKSPKFETTSILFFTKRKSALFCKTENPPPPFFPNRCCYLSAITQGPLYLLYYNASVSLYGPGGGGLFGAAGAATAAAVQKKDIPAPPHYRCLRKEVPLSYPGNLRQPPSPRIKRGGWMSLCILL